jgi:hypothetical protein
MNRILNGALIFALSLHFLCAVPEPLRAQGNPQSTQPPLTTVGGYNIDTSSLEKCFLALKDLTNSAVTGPLCSRLVADRADWQVRFFEVKYSDLNALREALSIFRAEVSVSPSLHVLSVKAPKEIIPAIEDAVKRLDVLPVRKKNVELTLYVLGGTDGQAKIAEGEAPPPAQRPIPQVLQPVVNQLKNLFAYKEFQLVDEIVLVGEDGQQVSTSGRVPAASFLAKSVSSPSYQFGARLQVQMPDQKEALVRINNFYFGIGGSGPNQARIDTAVEIQPGQQVVVGKATVGDSALILVLSARFL